MARRTTVYTMAPWTGGLNSSVDPGVLPSNDLVQADNVLFSASGTRVKREGFDYFDTELPSVISRSSTGTTRKLKFAASVNSSIPVNHLLTVGEKIAVKSSNTAYAILLATITSITTTTLENDTITYEAIGSLTESATSDASITVERNYSIIGTYDYWYFNVNNAQKEQMQIAVTSQGRIFRYDNGGRRTEITMAPPQLPIPASVSRSSTGTQRKIVFASSILDYISDGGYVKVLAAGNVSYITNDALVNQISSTNVPNDTITYSFIGAAIFNEANIADTTIDVDYDYAYSATPLVNEPSNCDIRAYNNVLCVTFSGTGNTPKFFNPLATLENVWADLPGAPDSNYMMEHHGRLWMDSKARRDRLEYSETFNHLVWGGTGDSGAIDVAQGDGDTQGISAIFPPFKGRLIVGKGDSVYQILGDTPETYSVADMTKGFGAASHKAVVPVDLDDIYFMSRRGFHSIIATDTTGDFAGNYLSRKIQPSFNTWSKGRARFTQGAYISTLNSVAWAVAEDGQNKGTALWLFNPTVEHGDGSKGAWYRWPRLNPQSVCTRLNDDKERVVIGDDKGRLLMGQTLKFSDRGDEGIPFRIKTGTVYVDGNPQSMKAFKKLSLLFKPRGRYSFTAYFKVDGFPVQALDFSQTITGDKLGVDFTLGMSSLGAAANVAPITKDVFGHGRGFSLEIFQSGLDAQVEIYGMMVEYEPADIADEVIQEG